MGVSAIEIFFAGLSTVYFWAFDDSFFVGVWATVWLLAGAWTKELWFFGDVWAAVEFLAGTSTTDFYTIEVTFLGYV